MTDITNPNTPATPQICRQCGATVTGNYCSNCGQSVRVKRITLHEVLHEVYHYFTHVDKGFLYTLRHLATRPGKMQRDYLEGHRSRYQKPFSLFFVCGTLAALALYLIHKPSGHVTASAAAESDFRRHYYVFLQAALLPAYGLVTWLVFRNNKLNYAEILVLFAYTMSAMLLLVIVTNLADLIPNKHLESDFYELPVLLTYLLWTNLTFFRHDKKWVVVLKTLVVMLACYYLSKFAGNWLVDHLTGG